MLKGARLEEAENSICGLIIDAYRKGKSDPRKYVTRKQALVTLSPLMHVARAICAVAITGTEEDREKLVSVLQSKV